MITSSFARIKVGQNRQLNHFEPVFQFCSIRLRDSEEAHFKKWPEWEQESSTFGVGVGGVKVTKVQATTARTLLRNESVHQSAEHWDRWGLKWITLIISPQSNILLEHSGSWYCCVLSSQFGTTTNIFFSFSGLTLSLKYFYIVEWSKKKIIIKVCVWVLWGDKNEPMSHFTSASWSCTTGQPCHLSRQSLCPNRNHVSHIL